MTTKDIIKLLPIDEVFKAQLLGNYDQLPLEKRFAIEQAAWDIYDAYILGRIEEKVQLALKKAQTENGGMLNPEFYEKVKAEAEKEVLEKGVMESEKVDLKATREQLATVMSGDK